MFYGSTTLSFMRTLVVSSIQLACVSSDTSALEALSPRSKSAYTMINNIDADLCFPNERMAPFVRVSIVRIVRVGAQVDAFELTTKSPGVLDSVQRPAVPEPSSGLQARSEAASDIATPASCTDKDSAISSPAGTHTLPALEEADEVEPLSVVRTAL